MFLIDGYNVVFARGKVTDVRAARAEFIRQVEEFCSRSGYRARIYFDSREGPLRSRTSCVEIIDVTAGVTADDAITAALEGTNDSTAYHVVSSDRAVADAARRRHASVTSSGDFLKLIAPDQPGPGEARGKTEGITDGEVDYWKRTFGIGGDDS